MVRLAWALSDVGPVGDRAGVDVAHLLRCQFVDARLRGHNDRDAVQGDGRALNARARLGILQLTEAMPMSQVPSTAMFTPVVESDCCTSTVT